MAGWIVGPVASTAALLAIAFIYTGLYASGGGLLIAAMIAFWTGAGAAGLADPNRQGRNAAIVAAYIVLLFTAWLFFLQSQSPPPGTLPGGPNTGPPR
jgi:hypothetical protein